MPFLRSVVAFGLLTLCFEPLAGQAPTATVRQAVLVLEVEDPDLAVALRPQAAEQIKKQGLALVPMDGADPQATYHLGFRMLQSKTAEGNLRFQVSGRLSLLKDLALTGQEAGASVKVWRSDQTVTVQNAGPSVKSALASILAQVQAKLWYKAGLREEPGDRSLRYVGVAGVAAPQTAPGAGSQAKVVQFDFSQMKVKFQPPPPAYPPLAKLAGIQGTVVVELVVDADGVTEQATAIQGPLQLRATAESYAMRWQFLPALLDGTPQRARFHLTMPFRLHNGTRVQIQQAVLEVATTDPALQYLIPALAAEAEATLKRLGIALVAGETAAPGAHHLSIEVFRPGYGGTGLVLSLRCCLLKDVQLGASGPTKPKALRTWSMEVLPGPDPVATLKGELHEAFREVVDVPTVTPIPAAGK